MRRLPYDALVVIDVQKALVERHPANEEQFVASVRAVVEACRCSRVPVLYVRHDGGVGDELECGADGWQVHRSVRPLDGETVIDKRFNSAFRQTELHERLQSLGAKRLVMCGMQTEYCFDVSVKVAFELGYEVTVPREAVTTFDNDFATGSALTAYFEDLIWDGRYAQVKSAAELLRALNGCFRM